MHEVILKHRGLGAIRTVSLGHVAAVATGGGHCTCACHAIPFRKYGLALGPHSPEVPIILNILVCFTQEDTVSESLTSMKGPQSPVLNIYNGYWMQLVKRVGKDNFTFFKNHLNLLILFYMLWL